ncbi:MAG TPA: NAD(P)-dependent oxidoreductase [Gemmatimonadales bacterium]|nr:NAD(P)-dependent oxidoreductase [Gemmatimonadales bacterium]
MECPTTEPELEELLSRPTAGLLETLATVPGDILILGAGGKMGPSLAMMARRALVALGRPDRVIAVSRFSEPGLAERLAAAGVEVRQADLLHPAALGSLPDAPNLVFMAGQKFGTHGNPATTWAMNAALPAFVAERYAGARTVVFSTGNVYPLWPVGSGGPTEDSSVGPIGEYAMSCLARERIFQHYALTRGTRALIFRLNYAVELRYGVLVDTGRRVLHGEAVPLTMGHVNLIWQGDANARALQCLAHTTSPATVLNVTGPEQLSIRWIAEQFGRYFGRTPLFEGTEAPDALLSNARRSVELFGPPAVPPDRVIEWTAAWLERGGRLLGKPTHFEERKGRF